MNGRNVLLIFRREVLDQVRDRRTLFMVAVLPVLLYPLMGIGTAQMTAVFTEQPRTVVILGADDLPNPPLVVGNRFASAWFRSPAEAEKLNVITDQKSLANETDSETMPSQPKADPSLSEARQLQVTIVERQQRERELAAARTEEASPAVAGLENSLIDLNQRLTAQFDRGPFQVLVIIPAGLGASVARRQTELNERIPTDQAAEAAPRPLIVLNSADEKSVIAHRRVRDVIEAWERSILKEQLRQSHLPETLTTPIHAADLDVAEQKHVAANVWSKIFPALLVIMTLTGAFYPAVDLCAGEKERGTMETLLICPATRTEIVLGKFLTVLLFSMTTAVLNLLSVGLTGKYMASLALSGASSRLGEFALPPVSSLVWVFVILIPLATLFSALCLAMATFARSSKEGQYYLTPLLMVALGLMMFCLSPGTEMQPFYSVIPVIGPGLLLKGLLKANGPDSDMYLYAIPVLATSIGYSLLALWWAIEQFGSEEVLFRESEQVDLKNWIRHLIRDRGPVPKFSTAGVCFLLIILCQFASWKPFQEAIRGMPRENQGLFQIQLLMVQQVFTIAAPALLLGFLLTSSLRQTFSLRWPGLFRMLCASVLPFAVHPLMFELLVRLQWFFPPAPPGIAELMKDLKTTDLWLAILAIAVVPAICEEIAFRGFMLSGFQSKGRTTLAVLLSSFAFGLIHMIPQQVFNAMLLGIVLGAMCVSTRSLWPGVVYHFVHNSLVVLHDRFGRLVPTEHAWNSFFRWEDQVLRYQPALLVTALVVGMGLLWCIVRPMPIHDSTDTLMPSTVENPS